MKKLTLSTAALAVALCATYTLTTCCVSFGYRDRVAQASSRIESSRLRQHVEALTALGPRRAGDPAAGIATVDYLERELHALGIDTERELFPLVPTASLTLLVSDAEAGPDAPVVEREVPGVYFGQTIGQERVASGFVEPGERLVSFSISRSDSTPVDQINLLATIKGRLHPERVLEISAHHDTVPGTVGADDNTSGVAVLLEVARMLSVTPPDCSVRLCFFAAEELGLLGAREHVSRLKIEGRLSEVFGLINLDTVGFYTDAEGSQTSPARIPLVVWPPKVGNFLAIVGGHGSADLANLIEASGKTYAPELPLYTLARLGGMLPDARRSDHAPYWDAEVPAVFLTDTGEFRNDRYHRPSDEVESLDFVALRNVAAVTLSSALVATAEKARE